MEKLTERDLPEGLSNVQANDRPAKPIMEAYDPHFGRPLFERSESFFRRYESAERPSADE